jgi:hypothetical protein
MGVEHAMSTSGSSSHVLCLPDVSGSQEQQVDEGGTAPVSSQPLAVVVSQGAFSSDAPGACGEGLCLNTLLGGLHQLRVNRWQEVPLEPLFPAPTPLPEPEAPNSWRQRVVGCVSRWLWR